MSYPDITKQVFPFAKGDQIFCARLGNGILKLNGNYTDKLWRPFLTCNNFEPNNLPVRLPIIDLL